MPKTVFSSYVARDIEGVKEISNEMTVAKTSETPVEKKSEEEIVGENGKENLHEEQTA